MDESVFESVNKAYTLLVGVQAGVGRLTDNDINYLVGLLEGTLKPYTVSDQAARRSKPSWWRKFTP